MASRIGEHVMSIDSVVTQPFSQFAAEGYRLDFHVQWYDLKLEWANPASELRFCIFQYMGFNDRYFKSLEDLAT